MKRQYVKPETEVIVFMCESQIMALSAGETLDGTEEGGSGSGMDADANRHRGEWGNLWAED